MMIKKERSSGDRLLLGVVVILILLGILMIYSASSFRGAEKYNDSARFLKLHLARVAIGFFFLIVISKIDYHWFRWLTPLLLLIFFGLLIVVLLGPPFHGSRRSILLFGRRFQPAEFMKLVVILYLGAIFAREGNSRDQSSDTLIVHYVVLLSIVGLVFIEPDMGTALVLFSVGYSMFFLAGVSSKQLAKVSLFLIPLVSIGIALFPYQKQRLVSYLSSVFGHGPVTYQIKQSIIGLANGGFAGVGYGGGKQKLFFLPEPFSDFILASFGEELGFLGFILLFGLLLFLLWRGIKIALKAPDRYGFLLAGGITAMILINALINAGVVVNLLPTTGLPFPFLSYGGSSLFVHLIGIGILFNISKQMGGLSREFESNRGRENLWLEEET